MKTTKKLIIHETDCHGCGRYHYNGKTKYYAYDDETGDIRGAVEALIEIGFINAEDVEIYDDDRDIYADVVPRSSESEVK